MSGKITISSQWKDISDMFIVKSGEWKRVKEVYVITSGEWKQWYLAAPSRAVTGGGAISTNNPFNIISYNTISTLGDSADFGDLSVARYAASSSSNRLNQRGYWVGGWISGYSTNTIDYVTINSVGDASDFGDEYQEYYFNPSTSNGTNERGIYGGGWSTTIGLATARIEYITINSLGNGTNFGSLIGANMDPSACSNDTNERGIFMGGKSYYGTYYNIIQYVTINSPGSATDSYDLINKPYHSRSTDNGINERAICTGGETASSTYTNVIQYFTINSLSNATDFGDLSVAKDFHSAESNLTNERALLIAGINYTGSNVIEYITINSTGDATDFGDLINDPFQQDTNSG